jgi:hypothetical protein
VFIPGAKEVGAGTTAARYHAIAGQQRMHQQLPGAFPEAEGCSIPEFPRVWASVCVIRIHNRPVHSVQKPGFAEGRIDAYDMVENE